MTWLRVLALRFSGMFGKRRRDAQIEEELQSHLELLVEQNLQRGMPPDEARREAKLELGGAEQIKEAVRDQRGLPFLESLIGDVRFALRMLRKNPGFATVAVLTLALGIGANTAIFSVVQAVVLAPLPYFQPDRLVAVSQSNPRVPRAAISFPNFQDWGRNARSFQQMAALGLTRQGYDLTSPGTPEHVNGGAVSLDFFKTLGVQLPLGRDFSPTEDTQGGAPVVVISNRLWRNRFGGDREALGKPITLDGVDYTIIGVTPRGFRFEGDRDVYTPLGQGDSSLLNNRPSHWILCIARLKPGVSISQAQAEMTTIQDRLDELYPEANRDLGTNIEPLKNVVVGDVGGTLLLLLGAVGLVLLIACANVANLLLTRSAARSREFAIRSALGANRARVVRQLLTESVLLSLAGGGLGIAVATWGVKSILATMPGIIPRSQEIHLNLPVLLFAFGVAVAVGVLFGLAPALKSSKSDLQEALKEGGRTSSNGQHPAQNTLVIIEMALTLVLLVASGLLFRTIRQLWNVNPGFDTQHIITFKMGISPSLKRTAANTRTAYQQLIERIRQISGVQAADFTDVVPLNRQGGTMPFWIGSTKPDSLQAAPRLVGFLTGPDYLRTLGIPLIRGRFFTPEDTIKSPCVVVIDSVLSRRYFQGSDPIGQTMTFGFAPTPPCQIIGVAGHVSDWGPKDATANIQNQVYFPMYQDPDQWVADNYKDLTVVVRTPLDAATLMPAVKAAIYGMGSNQPVYDVQTMQEIASDSMSSQRFPMILLGAFAALALLLASVGIYGVISYSVTQRVHEIGIRMALGARRRDIFLTTIGHGLWLAVAGLAVGIPVALILGHVLSAFSHLLYGVSASDPLTIVSVSLVLIAVAILACHIPARRAMRVDPMVALRYE